MVTKGLCVPKRSRRSRTFRDANATAFEITVTIWSQNGDVMERYLHCNILIIFSYTRIIFKNFRNSERSSSNRKSLRPFGMRWKVRLRSDRQKIYVPLIEQRNWLGFIIDRSGTGWSIFLWISV
jgi:hypothetical protein